MTDRIFETESDWFTAFEHELQGIPFPKMRKRQEEQYAIKTNIIESNQTVDGLVARFNAAQSKNGRTLTHIPSKEKLFSNVVLTIASTKKTEPGKFFFYLKRDPDERFWIVYNLEHQKLIKSQVKKIFQRQYKQDSIYLPTRTMETFQERFGALPGGVSIHFDQLFSESEYEGNYFDVGLDEEENDDENLDDLDQDLEDENNEIIDQKSQRGQRILQKSESQDNMKYTLRLWANSKGSYENIIKSLRVAHLPLNYRKLMCYFLEDSKNITLKEEFSNEGAFTVNGGRDLHRHIKFVEDIKAGYREKLEQIEDFRIDNLSGTGDLITLKLGLEIERMGFVNRINENTDKFRMYFTHLYPIDDSDLFRVADLHNGDHFYAQVFNDRIELNLHKRCCGNNVLRLFTNLEEFFSPASTLEVNGSDLGI